MTKVVGVRFSDTGKTYYFDPKGLDIKNGDEIIVETANGLEFGKASCGVKEVEDDEVVSPLKPVIRIANDNDREKVNENKIKEKEAFEICSKKIEKHQLEMNLTNAEYSFDCSKVIFYFTADGRIDFRELVKDLAATLQELNFAKSVSETKAKCLAVSVFAADRFAAQPFLTVSIPLLLKWLRTRGFHWLPAKSAALAAGLCVA